MCSVTRWSENGIAEVVARNMDWLEDLKSNIWLLPRGINREGLAGKNSLKWTSKYGSIITSAYDICSTDGINEKHLAGHLLWLAESDYGKRDENIPGLSLSLWLQYFLDNFAYVKEAVNYVENHPFQLLPNKAGDTGKIAQIHMIIEDSTGDAAVFEYIKGKLEIYHSREYIVMTNDPTFDKQIESLKQFKGFGGSKSLPGSTDSADRFTRGAYYQKNLPKPNNIRETIAGVISVARNIAQPFGSPDPIRPNISSTRWRTVSDLTNGVYFFESTTSPNIIWIFLSKLNFEKGSPVKKLDLVNEPDRIGDVTAEFEDSKPFEWLKPI
jgi:penicillin V acylase-like amidase (Ntn superfamily)